MFDAYWRMYCDKAHVKFRWVRFNCCMFTVIQRLVEDVEAATVCEDMAYPGD